MTRIQPLFGQWVIAGFPPVVTINGRTFARAKWKQGYSTVVEQYREAVPRNSMHLRIMKSGTWIVDHIDSYNPDMGFPVQHFLVDLIGGALGAFR